MKLNTKNPYIRQALSVVAPLGLDNEVHPDKIRLFDAANYVARLLDVEVEDPPTAEVLEHLGVGEDHPEYAKMLELVEAAFKAPEADKVIAERLQIEAAVKADPSLTKRFKEQLKAWAIQDIEEASAD